MPRQGAPAVHHLDSDLIWVCQVRFLAIVRGAFMLFGFNRPLASEYFRDRRQTRPQTSPAN
jgi:hypothetical protein